MRSGQIKNEAERLGFDLVGIAPATPSARAGAFQVWLDAGHQADMGWLARAPERRLAPAVALPGARSAVVVGLSYAVAPPPAERWDHPLHGRVARYAWGPDYHEVLLPMLQELGRFLEAGAGRPVAWRAYVDTGPVLERELAARAGLGFIGRNSLLINPGLGSLLFLGVILTGLELEPDAEAEDDGATLRAGSRVGGCGACRRCLQSCPTSAFPAPYVVDSRRCVSYLTIENRGPIPEPLRPGLGRWIFGCDECQTACPWVRRFSRPGRFRFLRPHPDLCAPFLPDLLRLDEAAFRERFHGTPLRRAKRAGLLRNACVVLGNSGSVDARDALERARRDADPLVAEHARWALARLGPASV